MADYPALYSTIRLAQMVKTLGTPVSRKWDGDLIEGVHQSAVLARLWSPTWQLIAPNRLRREIRRSPDPARRRPWRRQNVPGGALLFLQRQARSAFQYAGEIVDSRFFGHGASSGGRRFGKGWTDFEIRPALADEMWKELRFHSLYVDGNLLEPPDRESIHSPAELADVLDPLLRRNRVTVTIGDRVRGTLTYAKHGKGGELTHELHQSLKLAGAEHPGQGFDALFIFWEYGELSPFVKWRSRKQRPNPLSRRSSRDQDASSPKIAR